MMPHDHSDGRYACASDGGENVFEESAPSELQERFRPAAHALGFPGSQYDCSDQWDKAYMKVFTAMRYA